MNQEFRELIFKGSRDALDQIASDSGFNEMEQILSFDITDIGDYEGNMLIQMNFMPHYDDRDDLEVYQILVTLVGAVETELFDKVESSLNEINGEIMFGAFCLSRELKQVYLRYRIPLKNDDPEYSLELLGDICEELFETAEYYLPYLLVLCNEAGCPSLSVYKEMVG